MTVLLILLLNRGALTSPAPSPPSTQPASSGALGPVDVVPPPASAAADRSCPAVISRLPVTLAGQRSRPARSSSRYVAAWGEPPLVLRCGMPRPAGFVRASALTVVNGVQWYVDPGPAAAVWTVVDRPVYVELSVPAAYSSAPVVDLAKDITDALPARPIHPGG